MTLLLLLLASASTYADFSQRDWPYVKAINLPAEVQPDGLVELTPDHEVFAGAAKGLADLRIIADGNGETPYKLEISKPEHERNSLPVSIRDKGYITGSYNIFTADLGQAGILHNEIEIKTSATNFRRTAIVETSHDEATWMKIAEQTVYAFTVKERAFTTRDTRVRYTDSTARYLRVKILDNGEGPLEITGAAVFFAKETPAREVTWSSAILDISRDVDQRTTKVVVDLGTPGLPSYRLAIDIPDVNFYREVTLEASSDRNNWTTLMKRADIYAFDTPKFVGKSLTITYPETTSRYLRLVIHDEDSPPLTVKEVNVWGLWRRLIFAADPNQSYQLYYGNEKAKQPSYDIERVFPYLVTDVLPEATLGPQAANPDFVAKKPPVSERFPWLFPTVVALAAIVVALLLFAVFRQVRKALPPPKEP
jgi:hypothetical protein